MTVPRRIARCMEAAQGYLQLNMVDQALAELDAVDDRSSVEFEWHVLRGEALRERRDFQAALTAYDHAQGLQPESLEVFMGLAWCYKRTDQLPKSIETMQQAYLHHKDEPIVLYNLSCYYALSGNKEQALSWLGRALRMQPDLRRLIPDETDFTPLRDDPDFQRLLELAGKKV